MSKAFEFQMQSFNAAGGATLASLQLLRHERDQKAEMDVRLAERAAAEARGDGWLYGIDAAVVDFEDNRSGVAAPVEGTEAWFEAETIISGMAELIGGTGTIKFEEPR